MVIDGSYINKKICRNSELNQGHRDFQSLALPTELLRHIYLIFTGLVEQALRFPYTFRLSAPLGELLRHIYLILTGLTTHLFTAFLKAVSLLYLLNIINQVFFRKNNRKGKKPSYILYSNSVEQAKLLRFDLLPSVSFLL